MANRDTDGSAPGPWDRKRTPGDGAAVVRPLPALKRDSRGTTRATLLRLEHGADSGSQAPFPPYGRRAVDRAAAIWVDAAVREEIIARLRVAAELDGSRIEVFAAAGEVVLLGTVRTFKAEQHAVSIAASVPGVRSVMSQMHLVLHAVEDSSEGIAPAPPINDAGAASDSGETVA